MEDRFDVLVYLKAKVRLPEPIEIRSLEETGGRYQKWIVVLDVQIGRL